LQVCLMVRLETQPISHLEMFLGKKTKTKKKRKVNKCAIKASGNIKFLKELFEFLFTVISHTV